MQESKAQIPKSSRSKGVIKRVTPILQKEFKAKGLTWGSNIFIRVFKLTNELEVWVKKDTTYTLFKKYEVCYYSGPLGTKTKYGDGVSPEGFYFIKPSSLNPYSTFHLSINVGYPNKLERQKSYTGDGIMIHGNCVSIGCYAMGDSNIEEIYTLVQTTLEFNQPFIRLHIFPFRMYDTKMVLVKHSKWYEFWKNLKEGYDWFEKKKTPPNVEVKEGKYIFD